MNDPMIKKKYALYMEDLKCLHKSVITKVGHQEINQKNYNWIELDETIFHPKGGGQMDDAGTIGGVQVDYVHKNVVDKAKPDQFKIYHCFETSKPFNFKVGDQVELIVDTSTRQLNSRLHTAGHLLADAVNHCFKELEGYLGNHHRDGSYVKFKILGSINIENKELFKEKVEATLNCWIEENKEVSCILEPSGIRSVKVFKNWTPCGGTHVNYLKEICKMAISDLSINKKQGTVTVKYFLF